MNGIFYVFAGYDYYPRVHVRSVLVRPALSG